MHSSGEERSRYGADRNQMRIVDGVGFLTKDAMDGYLLFRPRGLDRRDRGLYYSTSRGQPTGRTLIEVFKGNPDILRRIVQYVVKLYGKRRGYFNKEEYSMLEGRDCLRSTVGTAYCSMMPPAMDSGSQGIFLGPYCSTP